jgi:Uri superfamily endonuclease
MKGIYVLIILVAEDTCLKVGSLGIIEFQKSLYAYVGSAQNNLEKRILRHLRKTEKREFWHIDHLLSKNSARILRVFYEKAGRSEECKVAKLLGDKGVPIAGFGSSDCRCKSHLFKIQEGYFLTDTMQDLKANPLDISLCALNTTIKVQQ